MRKTCKAFFQIKTQMNFFDKKFVHPALPGVKDAAAAFLPAQHLVFHSSPAVSVNRAALASTCFEELEKWTFPEKSPTFDLFRAGRRVCQQANALLCGRLPFNPIIVTRQLPARPKNSVFRKSLLNNQINAHAGNSPRPEASWVVELQRRLLQIQTSEFAKSCTY